MPWRHLPTPCGANPSEALAFVYLKAPRLDPGKGPETAARLQQQALAPAMKKAPQAKYAGLFYVE
jgi:hypothetical protein